MKSAVCVLLSALLLVAAAPVTAEKALLTKQEVDRLWKTWEPGMIGTDTLEKTIDISPNTKKKIEFSITSKGNGMISLPGIDVLIYSTYAHRSSYKDPLLKNELVDLDRDGYKDIVLWGIVELFDPDTDEEKGEVPVVSVFHYNPKTGKFENTLPSEHVGTDTP